ncbi:TM2 domain protein [Rothia aeria F0184]|nr:TM2 domain protein [Rothia aeria F0184]
MSQEPHVNQQNHEANKYPSHPGQLQPQPVVATPAVVMVQQPVSVGVAYVLWFFLGGLGVHKFYLKQAVMGVVMLVLWIGGIILSATLIGALIGVPMLIAWIVLWIIDACTMPNRINELNGVVAVAPTRPM